MRLYCETTVDRAYKRKCKVRKVVIRNGSCKVFYCRLYPAQPNKYEHKAMNADTDLYRAIMSADLIISDSELNDIVEIVRDTYDRLEEKESQALLFTVMNTMFEEADDIAVNFTGGFRMDDNSVVIFHDKTNASEGILKSLLKTEGCGHEV